MHSARTHDLLPFLVIAAAASVVSVSCGGAPQAMPPPPAPPAPDGAPLEELEVDHPCWEDADAAVISGIQVVTTTEPETICHEPLALQLFSDRNTYVHIELGDTGISWERVLSPGENRLVLLRDGIDDLPQPPPVSGNLQVTAFDHCTYVFGRTIEAEPVAISNEFCREGQTAPGECVPDPFNPASCE